jgi:hypothetical protein
VIPRNVRLAEAPSYGQPGVVFDPASKGAQAFVEFAREMVARRSGRRRLGPGARLSDPLLSRIEDASLNASAPPQQRWLDGWLVRFSPGKAKRARCVNAVAARAPAGRPTSWRRPAEVFRDAGLPMVVRLTPFSQPADLDATLAALGLAPLRRHPGDGCAANSRRWPTGAARRPGGAAAWGRQTTPIVGALRGSPPEQRQAHADRLAASPVPYRGWVLQRDDGELLACGQYGAKANWSGCTTCSPPPAPATRAVHASSVRGCCAVRRPKVRATAYLQVDGGNALRWRSTSGWVYRRLSLPLPAADPTWPRACEATERPGRYRPRPSSAPGARSSPAPRRRWRPCPGCPGGTSSTWLSLAKTKSRTVGVVAGLHVEEAVSSVPGRASGITRTKRSPA